MAKEKMKNVKSSFGLLLFCALIFTCLLTVQNREGIYLIIATSFATIINGFKFRLTAFIIIVIAYIVSLFQIWNSGLYTTLTPATAACFDICIGENFMVWIIKIFSLILLPIIVYYSYIILNNGVAHDNTRN